jgi:predicted dehydrogenase
VSAHGRSKALTPERLREGGVVSRHRVAVIGAGYFAAFHHEGWQALRSGFDVEVAGLADLDVGRAAALAQRFSVPRHHADAKSLLDAVQPTLVDVVLPPQAQAAVVREALARGLPVICQKPFGRDLAEASALASLAAELGVPLVVHENFRFTPWFRECRRLIDAGHFGRLHGVSFRLRPGDGQGPRAYLERQPYFQTMPQLLVRETAVHFIDSFRFLLGEVRAVSARLRRLNPVIAGEDAGLVIFEFDDARTGLFDGNRLNGHAAADARRTLGEMWLEGEAGVLRLDGDARLWWQPHGGRELEHAYPHDAPGAFGGAVTALQSHVLRHFEQGAALENSAAEYLHNLHVQEAIYHSHATGRRVEMASFVPSGSETKGDYTCSA